MDSLAPIPLPKPEVSLGARLTVLAREWGQGNEKSHSQLDRMRLKDKIRNALIIKRYFLRFMGRLDLQLWTRIAAVNRRRNNVGQASRLLWPRSGQTRTRLRRWAGETPALRLRFTFYVLLPAWRAIAFSRPGVKLAP